MHILTLNELERKALYLTRKIIMEEPEGSPDEIIGIKGFDENLKCKDFQYEIGKCYGTGHMSNPRICSNEGIHYCKTLPQVFTYYPNDGKNRFCEVRVLGRYTDNSDKSCTTILEIIRELTKEEINKVIEEEKIRGFHKTIHLDKVKEFLTKYPMAHLAGSLSLLIHGCKLKRLGDGLSDIDAVFPYFVEIPSSFENGDPYDFVEEYKSGSDFDFNIMWKGLKIDVVIDPKERYETIEYDGFKFRVNRLEDVLMAKLKYALQGNSKHRDDVYELVGKKSK